MRWPLAAIIKSALRDRRGATAVEFAIIALPFVTLVWAIFELGMVFFVSTTLETALDNTARQIRTGQMQAAAVDQAGFKQRVCRQMTWLAGQCDANLSLDVRTFTTFGGVNAPDPVVDGELDDGQMTYNPGGGNEIVLVRAFYKWRLITPGLNDSLVNLNGGRRLISASTAFRNEPFT